jgi:hypothetical protein
MPTRIQQLTREDRLRLMRFVCSFAWADLEVQDEERDFVGKLVTALQLAPDEAARVAGWLVVPPAPEEVDPLDVPLAHRELFLEAVRAVVVRDGIISPGEEESFDLLEQLLR